MLNLLLVDEVKLSKLASQDELESMSKLAVSFEDESKNMSPIKSKKKSLDWSNSAKGSDNCTEWTEWNLRKWVSRVLWETNFLEQLGHDILVGILETSDVEEIKEQASICLRKQTPLCLKEAWQYGQVNITKEKLRKVTKG